MRYAGIVTTLAALATAVLAQDLTQPKAAWEQMQREVASARAKRDWNKARSFSATRTQEFLAAWDKSGSTAKGEQRFYLGEFLLAGGRYVEALDAFQACAGNQTLDGALRNQARVRFAGALSSALLGKKIETRAAEARLKWAEAEVDAIEGEAQDRARATLHNYLGRCCDQLHRKQPAIDHWMAAARAYPGYAYSAARSVIWKLMEGVHELDAYPALRERGNKLLAELVELQEKQVASLREAGPGQEKALASAERILERMRSMGKPLEMLGKPAPDWTLVHAFSKTRSLEELRGKVVVADFWATWCGWCVRSFPAVRDLLRDYKGKDLAFVGVTASASYVTDQRYTLDEDMKPKVATAPAPVNLRRPQNATEAQLAEFKVQERKLIEAFLKNHEVTWDVVMIDESEPSAKYALTGWPHAIVLDRKGRVRYFKRGALLRDRPEAVAKFRAVLDALLAEKD